MRKYFNYFIGLFLAVVFILTTAIPVFAIAQPTSSTINWIGCYRNYIEVGDQFYLFEYTTSYGALPTETIGEAYIFRVMDGATEISTGTAYGYEDKGYCHGIAGLYVTSASAPVWANVPTFNGQLNGNPALTWVAPATPPTTSLLMSYTYDGSTTDATETMLTARLRTLIMDIEVDWAVDLIQTNADGSAKLTSYGEDYVVNSIPYVRMACPDLFSTAMSNFDYDERDYSQTYANSLNTRLTGTKEDNQPLATSTGLSLNYVGGIIGIVLGNYLGIQMAVKSGKPQIYSFILAMTLGFLGYMGKTNLIFMVGCYILAGVCFVFTFFYKGA